MIDKGKYTYWMEQNGSSPGIDELVSRELYARVGFYLHLAQMIEYNLANIISLVKTDIDYLKIYSQREFLKIKKQVLENYEEESKKDFCKIIKDFKATEYFNEESFADIDKIRKFRNYLAHQIFVELNHNGGIENLEYDDYLVDKINDMEDLAAGTNNKLVSLFSFLSTTQKTSNPSESNKA